MAFFTIPTVLKFLQALPTAIAALPAVKETFDGIVGTFKNPQDQETLQRAYREHQAENAGGHVRLQEMLRKAELEE